MSSSGSENSNTGNTESCLFQLFSDSEQDSDRIQYPNDEIVDTRSHIVVELYDTERSYVESLQTLVSKYLQSLKSTENAGLVEPYVVQEIFYQIPEIMSFHEIFLEELRIRLEGWNKSKCIGDIFLETFTKQEVIDSYMAFISNWKSAKEAVKSTCQSRPAFARFLERHRNIVVDDDVIRWSSKLLVPKRKRCRYIVAVICRLRQTEKLHSDMPIYPEEYTVESMAREHKGKLALDSLLIMPVQRIPRYELLIQSLIKHTECCHPDYEKLLEAQRQVHELAVRINCTERENDELVQLENLIDGLHNLISAERTFLRYDLVTMTCGQGLSRKERALFLFNDLLVITSMKRRSSTIKKPPLSNLGSIASSLEANKYKLLMKIPLEHVGIVKVKDDALKKQMKEMEYLSEDVTTLSQMLDLVSTLHCPHNQLEDSVREMLSCLNKQLNERHISEIQLCYLELAIYTRNSVENIAVIFPKPEKKTTWEEVFLEAKGRISLSGDRRNCPEFLNSVPIRKTRAGLQFTCAAASYNQHDVWVCNSDGYVGQVCVLSLHPEPTVTSCNGVCNARILCVTSVPTPQTPNMEKTNFDEQAELSKEDSLDEVSGNILAENSERDITDIHLDSSSSSDDDDEGMPSASELSGENSENCDSFTEPTMWLGTEDGSIHIYNCTDSLRVKRNRVKIQHSSAVCSIICLEKTVFVALANGDICVHNWDPISGWNTTEGTTLNIGCAAMPVSKMFPVWGKLWCICHNIIKVLNISTLQIEHMFSINGESNRAITGAILSGLGVWMSIQNSSLLRVVHAMNYEVLAEINIMPGVTKMLSCCDVIIRQHKAACLRVTSLMACKDRLWIGTSAGVILTLTLPIIKQNTSRLPVLPHVTGVHHGHTGHVRFLTAVKNTSINKQRSSKISSKKPDPDNDRMLVISGGDGYEDFRTSSMSEIAGREDSTNHLLLWRV